MSNNPTDLDEPELTTFLERALKDIESKGYTEIKLKMILAAVAVKKLEWQDEAYKRGYNTGWIKARRSHDKRRLTIAADQLEALAKTLRESAALTQQPHRKEPPA